jgi:hypothetical protein
VIGYAADSPGKARLVLFASRAKLDLLDQTPSADLSLLQQLPSRKKESCARAKRARDHRLPRMSQADAKDSGFTPEGLRRDKCPFQIAQFHVRRIGLASKGLP